MGVTGGRLVVRRDMGGVERHSHGKRGAWPTWWAPCCICMGRRTRTPGLPLWTPVLTCEGFGAPPAAACACGASAEWRHVTFTAACALFGRPRLGAARLATPIHRATQRALLSPTLSCSISHTPGAVQQQRKHVVRCCGRSPHLCTPEPSQPTPAPAPAHVCFTR